MELLLMIFVPLAIPCLGVATIVRIVNEGRRIDEENKALAPVRQENLEEDIDDILARHRQSRRERRARDKQAWDEWYLSSLPVEEHPDYFELDFSTDQVERFTQKSANGMVCKEIESRANSMGVPYTLDVDHVTQMATVSTRRISWEVPLSTIDVKQLPR